MRWRRIIVTMCESEMVMGVSKIAIVGWEVM